MSEDQLQPDDTLDDRGVEDVLDEGYSPLDREPAHLRHPHEVDEPETLDERLAEEQPEEWADPDSTGDAEESDTEPDDRAEVGNARAGRLVGENEGTDEDDDDEPYAEDEGIDGGAASAEEAAVHVIDDDDEEYED